MADLTSDQAELAVRGCTTVSTSATVSAAGSYVPIPCTTNGVPTLGTSSQWFALNGAGFVTLTSQTVTLNTNENPVFLIKNPSGSNKLLRVDRITFSLSVTGNFGTTFRIYQNPTVTANGTAGTISSTLVGSGNSSAMNVYTGPTVSANGTQVFQSFLNNGATNQIIDLDQEFVIQPNNTLLVTAQVTNVNTTFSFSAIWYEVNG